MSATFTALDANSGALTLGSGVTSAQLFRMDVETFEVTSNVLPWFWTRSMSKAHRKLAQFLTAGERKSLDFASMLLSVGDADGGSDAQMSVSVLGTAVTVSVSAPAGSTVLLSIQRRGGSVRPATSAPASSGSGGGGGSVDLSPYALKTELPDLDPYALKTELPDLDPYALKTELPSVAGLLSSTDAAAAYATKTALSDVAGFRQERLFFVAKNGNDSTGNGSYGQPFLTIGAALTAANAVSGGYVRINVAPGEYTENVTISRARTILAGAGVDPEDHTTSLMGTLTVDCAAATQRYNDVVAVQGFYVNNGAKVTGTGAFMVVFTDCYLTTGVTANNAVLVDNSHADRSIVYLRNCSVTKQGSASTDVVKLSRGDVRMDTVRVYGAIPGTGNGIAINNNATLTADRMQVDHSMQGAAIRVDGSYAGTQLTLSNSSLKCNYVGSDASPGLYLKNDTGVGALLWQVLFIVADTTSNFAIDGVYNGGATTPPLLYGHVTFVPGTNSTLGAQVSAAKLKMTDLA